MKKFLASVGVLSVPFGAVVGSNFVCAQNVNLLKKKTQGALAVNNEGKSSKIKEIEAKQQKVSLVSKKGINGIINGVNKKQREEEISAVSSKKGNDGKIESKQQNILIANAENSADKLDGQLTTEAGVENGINEKQQENSFFGIEKIKTDSFVINKAILKDVDFMAEKMPIIQDEPWLKSAGLVDKDKNKEEWKEFFTKRIESEKVEEFFIKDKTGAVVGHFEIHKNSNVYRFYFVSINEHKELLKKAAQEVLNFVSKHAKKGTVIELVTSTGEYESEYEKFCKEVIKGSENGYNFRFEKSSFDIRAGRGVRFFALRV